jgi:hypothetical protein
MSVALPSELDFSLPMSLPDNRSYELRTQPNNASTFSTQGSVIQISLPQLQRSFYESNSTYLTGRINVTCAGTAGTDVLWMNPAGAYGCFSRWTVRTSGGQTLDDIQNPGYVANVLLNVGLNSSERIAYANSMLLHQSTAENNLGIQFNLASSPGQGTVLDFSIPMIGLLNMTKYLPAYGTELILELTLGAASSWTVPGSATAAVTAFTFSNIELVTQVLEFSPSSFQMIQAQYADKIVLKSETYSFGSTTLAAQSAGTVDIPFQIRCNSLKRLFMIVSPNDVAEGIGYGSVNPNANSISFINNGIQYPMGRGVQCQRPAECFSQLIKSFGGLYSADKSSHISVAGFRRASTAYVSGVYAAYNATKTAAMMGAAPNKWFFVLDLETLTNHKDTMYNGVNTAGSSSNYIRIDIGTALANNAHTVNYFSCHDVLLNMDLQTGIVSAIV